MPRSPGALAALDAVLDDMRADLHVALPGRVESYDSATQTASVKPMLKRVSRGVDDAREVDALPVISDVPVAFSRGGTYYLTFPLVPGDSGLLVFAESDLGPWRHTGTDSDPLDEGRHGLTGAVFYPGLETVARALSSLPDHLVLGKEGGPSLDIDGSHVGVGGSGGSAIVYDDGTPTGLSAWIKAVSTATGASPPTTFKASIGRVT